MWENEPLGITYLGVFGCMRDVVFINDSTSNNSDLEMCSSGRNEASIMVGVVESSVWFW